jgi:hypothetical protein
MKLTKADGSPAPTHLSVTRTWTYDVQQAAESLAEFSDHPVTYQDVYDLICDWITEDVREPVGESLPAIEEVYDVTKVTSEIPNDRA